MANVFVKILLKYSKRIYKEKTFAILGKPGRYLSKNLGKYLLRLHAPLVPFSTDKFFFAKSSQIFIFQCKERRQIYKFSYLCLLPLHGNLKICELFAKKNLSVEKGSKQTYLI